jgi:hypothetical protein
MFSYKAICVLLLHIYSLKTKVYLPCWYLAESLLFFRLLYSVYFELSNVKHEEIIWPIVTTV